MDDNKQVIGGCSAHLKAGNTLEPETQSLSSLLAQSHDDGDKDDDYVDDVDDDDNNDDVDDVDEDDDVEEDGDVG